MLAILFFVCGGLALLLSTPPGAPLSVAATVAALSADRALVNTPQPSLGCGKRPPIAAGMSGRGQLRTGGLTRTYWLHVPPHYQPKHRYPLVLAFHGHTGSARLEERITGFSSLADRVGFLVAYPQGAVGSDRLTGWASGGPHKPRVDDVLFVSDLLSRLQAQVCVDPRRIYATGFSNGGGMTSVLACQLAGRIAAFAPVSGSYYAPPGGCDPGRPVPILEFHGTADQTVPYQGRPWLRELGALQWVGAWAARDGCAATPTQSAVMRGVTRWEWTGCQGNASVVHYRLVGGIHRWPSIAGSGVLIRFATPRVDREISATNRIWRFFAAHPLPTQSSSTISAASHQGAA